MNIFFNEKEENEEDDEEISNGYPDDDNNYEERKRSNCGIKKDELIDEINLFKNLSINFNGEN